MDMKELLTQTTEELSRMLAEAERDEQTIRRKIALRSHAKTAESTILRRQIARVKTALAEQKRSATNQAVDGSTTV